MSDSSAKKENFSRACWKQNIFLQYIWKTSTT